MKLGDTQGFASPEEALVHYGKKGMRWGVINEDRPVGETKKAAPSQKKTTTGEEEHEGIGGLSSNQKKALVAGGVVVAGAVGYMAYRHYAGGTGGLHIPNEFDVSKLSDRPLSQVGLGKLDHGHDFLKLDAPEELMVNLSRGYADVRPVKGFGNQAVAARHAELIKTLESMREKYPAVRNMNIEVVPMSYTPGMEEPTSLKCAAAVQSLKKGEARILYNDLMGELSSSEKARIRDMQPGVFHKDFLGYHEMGHLLAVANGDIPPGYKMATRTASPRETFKWTRFTYKRHEALFKKHGLSYSDLRKLSKYAGTQPAEALAELHAYVNTPDFRKQMDPDLVRKAESLFNDMGGLT